MALREQQGQDQDETKQNGDKAGGMMLPPRASTQFSQYDNQIKNTEFNAQSLLSGTVACCEDTFMKFLTKVS